MMNYLKKFEHFQDHEEIHKICEKYDINNYTINSDGSVDVDGDVNLHFKMLKRLPLKFNHVSGDFWCYNNFLTTLEGSPQSVGGNFNCLNNFLTTLEGSPQSVGLDFNCHSNRLTTLKGAPQSVDSFDCFYNKYLKSLNYLPKYIRNEKVDFRNTAVYEIFKLLDNFSLGMIRLVNDLKVIVDDKIDIEKLNDLLYDQGKPPVENVKGYINI